VEGQYGDKKTKLKKRRSRKRLTNQCKTEREASVDEPPVKEARNKKLYDWKAKTRHFEVNDLVYVYWPVAKPGLTRKLRKSLSGPYKISRKILELNY
jgi:hypothetical protein